MERSPRAEKTALVVDDDVFVVSALADVLAEAGWSVHTASNGFSAVRLAIDCRPAVILLDLVMPERSGGDVLAELRAEPATRDVAIVVVSGNSQTLTDEQRAQIDALIDKPFDVSDLIDTVNRALQRAAARHADMTRVPAISRREVPLRSRRGSIIRRTRGRR